MWRMTLCFDGRESCCRRVYRTKRYRSHMKDVKTKQLLRTKVWFPAIDKLEESAVRSCIACQAATPATNIEPLQMTELPHGPWESLSADYLGPLPSGEYLLVMIDNYSRLLVVEVVSSTAADVAIRAFDHTFALMGGITDLKTDNGSSFQSQQFADFAESLGFTQHKITTLFPSANGFGERFMRCLNKARQAAHIEHKN